MLRPNMFGALSCAHQECCRSADAPQMAPPARRKVLQTCWGSHETSPNVLGLAGKCSKLLWQ
eukprot:15474399-Alexandrium_andersonii.AAC.1